MSAGKSYVTTFLTNNYTSTLIIIFILTENCTLLNEKLGLIFLLKEEKVHLSRNSASGCCLNVSFFLNFNKTQLSFTTLYLCELERHDAFMILWKYRYCCTEIFLSVSVLLQGTHSLLKQRNDVMTCRGTIGQYENHLSSSGGLSTFWITYHEKIRFLWYLFDYRIPASSSVPWIPSSAVPPVPWVPSTRTVSTTSRTTAAPSEPSMVVPNPV